MLHNTQSLLHDSINSLRTYTIHATRRELVETRQNQYAALPPPCLMILTIAAILFAFTAALHSLITTFLDFPTLRLAAR